MKKYIAIVSAVILLLFGFDHLYYRMGLYISFGTPKNIEVVARTEGKEIMINSAGKFEPFEIKGVNLGTGVPGEWSTDFAIDEETYKRWFGYIKEMGANTIRIYTIQSDDFYNAFYEYNKNNPDPLYLVHGVWVNDHVLNSYKDAYHKDFFDALSTDCRTVVDIIHGKKKLNLGRDASSGHGSYLKDISPWCLGYIVGVEWEDLVVAYTNEKFKAYEEYTSYTGEYLRTSDEATPFETMLTRVGDKMLAYETNRYGVQRLIAFANWPTTDPFEYTELGRDVLIKCAEVNVENIICTDKVLSGQFASYHVYPYYPDYLTFLEDWTPFGIDETEFVDEEGRLNTYLAYLTMLNKHHSMPVVVTEFGIPTSRAMAHEDLNTGRNQGKMNEQQQGYALAECYRDIKAAGCAGSCVFSWQDEWFKRTWNTMHAINLSRNPYWSDYQTNEQYFGLLAFDSGEEESVCYVDGDIGEWKAEDVVTKNGDVSLSYKYDEKFVYFMVEKDGLDFENDTLYIPLDITPKSGSNFCEDMNLKFDRNADFIITISGKENSRVLVQERYEALRSTYSQQVYNFDTYEKKHIPKKNSPVFKQIHLLLHKKALQTARSDENVEQTFETGKLVYGNANPESENFDSLADFCRSGDCIEIKLPWQLLNFYDPSLMQIHDDYYDGNYGIKPLATDEMFVGVCEAGEGNRTVLGKIELQGWGNDVTYHERLKESYYIMQDLWKSN